MTSMANQGSHIHPNVLRSQTAPNTLGGFALPTATPGLSRFRPFTMVGVAGAILACLALAFAFLSGLTL